MSEESDECGEVYNHYLELSKPTKEDFERVFTEAELKELCLKHKCRVDMYRWNIVNDYRILFTRSGRYPRWSERVRLHTLAKAVNKMKPSVLYDDEDIKKTRKEEWEMQLKDNILSLNFWRRKEQQKNSRLQVQESEQNNIDQEMESQFQLHSESIMGSFTQSESMPLTQSKSDQLVQLEVEVMTQSMDANEMPIPNQRNVSSQMEANTIVTTNDQVSPDQSQKNVILAEPDNTEFIEGDSNDSVATVLETEREQEFLKKNLPSEEIVPEIANIYDVDTLSMSIDPLPPTQSQDVPISQSEGVIPPSYEMFENIITATSTQSQKQESEELIVD